jgi:hypothetical protein
MSSQNKLKRFSLPVSILISLFFVVLAYSLPSINKDLKIGYDVSFADCDTVTTIGNPEQGDCTTTPQCGGGWCVCLYCHDEGSGGSTGGGPSTCSNAACSGWDQSGNWFEYTCGSPNTCYEGSCGSPCDVGCADRDNCNICPLTAQNCGPAPTCSDGIQNQGETAIDCGGPNCSACAAGPTCSDGIQNQGETAVDCGGPNCAACAAGPTCTDGVQNQQETGIDCGGPNCAACGGGDTDGDGIPDGSDACPTVPGVANADPAKHGCPAESCSDGIQNQNETGVDTGGVCDVGSDEADITVSSNISATWTVSSSDWSANGSGFSGSYTVHPNTDGHVYTISPGSIANFIVQVTNSITGTGNSFSLFNGDSGVFTLEYLPNTGIRVLSDLPSATWSISPGGYSGSGNNSAWFPVTGDLSYTITPQTVPGYSVSVSNTDGAGATMTVPTGQRKTYTIDYTPSGGFDYSLTPTSNSITIVKGGTNQFGQNTITTTLTSGTTQNVGLTIGGAPAGITYALSPAGGCSPNCSSTATFTIPPSTVSGTYPITITGNPLGRTTVFNLVIQNSSAIVVTCSPSPSTALLGQNVRWTANASGGTGPYTYSWSGTNVPTPAPTGSSFNITYSTIGQKIAQVTVTDSLNNTGSCNAPGGTVQVNFNPQFKEF